MVADQTLTEQTVQILHWVFLQPLLFSTLSSLVHTHLIGKQFSVTELGCKLKKQSILHHNSYQNARGGGVRHRQRLKLNMAPFVN